MLKTACYDILCLCEILTQYIVFVWNYLFFRGDYCEAYKNWFLFRYLLSFSSY